MKPRSIAIVGAAETTELGKIPDASQIQLHADAALNAMADCGLGPKTSTASPAPPNGPPSWPITWASPPPGWTAPWSGAVLL